MAKPPPICTREKPRKRIRAIERHEGIALYGEQSVIPGAAVPIKYYLCPNCGRLMKRKADIEK